MKKDIEIKGKHAMFINCKIVKLDLFRKMARKILNN